MGLLSISETSDNRRTRLTWGMAAFLLHVPPLALLLPDANGVETGAKPGIPPLVLLFFFSLVPGTIAVLLYLSDVKANPRLTGTQRRRWLLLIGLFPYSLIAYWAKHGRKH